MAIGSMFGPGQRFRTIILYTIIQAVAIYPLIAHAARLQSASLRAPSHRHSAQHDNHPESYPAYSNFVAHGQVHQKRDTSARCSIGFAGDQDTYGLGIRIGLYFQWVTSSIAYNLVPSEAITMRGVNNCFQAAMFAGLLFVTKTKFPQNELHAVEAYLMLLFCMGGVCSGTLAVDGGGEESTVRKGYAYLEASTLGGYVRLLLGTGFIAYGLWFVYVGMDGMLDAFPDDCRHAFFFAKVDLNGWFRTFLKVIFVFIAIPAVLSLAFGTHSLIKATSAFVFEGGWKGRVRNQNSTLPDEDTKPGFQDLELHKGNIGFSGALLLFIVAVELTIKWNKIEGVGDIGSTGQLLPVIIGVGGVGRVMVRLISDMLEHAALVRQEKSLRARTGAANNSVQVQDQLKSSQTTGGGNTFVHSIEGLHFSKP